MGTTRLFKIWFFIALMLAGKGSLVFGQTNTFPDDGNVGIGTASPASVMGDGARTVLELGATSAGKLPELVLRAGSAFAQRNWSILIDNPTSDETDFRVKLGLTNLLKISKDGNVGIGTTNPTSKLHVAGDAKITGNLTVDGNIAAKYQDVAEWVRTPVPLVPGTVVVIDPVENNRVLPASRPYDTGVAGVVSAQPGIILGEAGDDKAKVAHSGRVKVKVDAQYGAVSVGDLLVSSSTSGYAMVSKPIDFNGVSLHRPGTIVGKALEPLKEGQGEILVLLTLQ